MSNIQNKKTWVLPTEVDAVFTQFTPQEIEDFYHLYQLWSLQRRRAELTTQIENLQKQITEHEIHLQASTPSGIALATLSQFQASGVDDIDLLDRMLERGDVWLDHALQLLEHCERLGMIQGNINEWCEHALEGAYDWIETMESNTLPLQDDSEGEETTHDTSSAYEEQYFEVSTLETPTEDDFLQKLMSGENDDAIAQNAAIINDEQVLEVELHPAPVEDLLDVGEDLEPTNEALAIRDEAKNDEEYRFEETMQFVDDTPVAVTAEDFFQKLISSEEDNEAPIPATSILLEEDLIEEEAYSPIVATEEDLLQKLMSDDDEVTQQLAKITLIERTKPGIVAPEETGAEIIAEPPAPLLDETSDAIAEEVQVTLPEETSAEIVAEPPGPLPDETSDAIAEEVQVTLPEETGAEIVTETQTLLPNETDHEIAEGIQTTLPEETSAEIVTETQALLPNETEEERNADYIRTIAFAESISELEMDTPPGLAAPLIENLEPFTPQEEQQTTRGQQQIATPTEQDRPATQETRQTRGGSQTIETTPEEPGEPAVKDTKKKPLTEPKKQKRGFFQRLLAKILQR